MVKILSITDRMVSILTICAGIAIALMMFHVSIDVLLRYTIGKGLPGTLTIVSYYYMVIVAFMPLAYAELKQSHIQMEVLTELLPARSQFRLQGWLLVPTALVTGVLTWRGSEEAMTQYAIGAVQIQGSTSILVWPSYFILPVGAGLMTIIITLKFIGFLSGHETIKNPDASTNIE